MTICHIFTLTEHIKNPFCEFEDIYQKIFLAKFHENPTFQRGGGGEIDSISKSADPLSLKSNHLPSVTLDFHETFEERSPEGIFAVKVKIWLIFLIYEVNRNP